MNLDLKRPTQLLVWGLGVFLLAGCTGKTWHEFQMAKDRDTLETHTPGFNPGYFKKQSSQHLAIFFDIVEGEIVLNPRPAELRPGSLPYQSRSAGDVRIAYFDSTEKELGHYALENPLVARSCDFEGKSRMGETKPILRGTIEVLVPNNMAITYVEIGPTHQKGKRFKVGEVIKGSRSD